MVRVCKTIGHNGDLEQIYNKADACSKDLISDFQTIIQIIKTLSQNNIRVFEDLSLQSETLSE